MNKRAVDYALVAILVTIIGGAVTWVMSVENRLATTATKAFVYQEIRTAKQTLRNENKDMEKELKNEDKSLERELKNNIEKLRYQINSLKH